MATIVRWPTSGGKRWCALAFTPCLQYQYAAGKNIVRYCLALDAMEALFDGRATTFCYRHQRL